MKPQNNRTVRAYVALVCGLLILGLSAILVRLANVPGTIAAMYRIGIAVIVVSPAVLRSNARQGLPAWPQLRLAIIAGLFFAGDLAAWSTGVMLSGATNPTLLANTAPLWVGLGAVLIFKERLPRQFWLGLLLALLGAGIVLGLDAFRGFDLGLGTLLGLVASFFYGGYFLIAQKGREQLGVVNFYWFSIAANGLALIGLNLVLGHSFFSYDLRSYLYLLALALGPQVVGWMLINYAQGHLRAAIVSPTLLGQPVLTAVFAALLLAEPVLPLQVVGGLAVLAGVFLVHRSQRKRRVAE